MDHQISSSPAAVDALPLPHPPALRESLAYRLKCRLLGPPLVTARLRHERLSEPVALGVLSPDCISSSAYGPEEMLIELLPYFGVLAFTLVLPVTATILFILLLLTFSYRDVVSVYTRSGGSYVVARENFGPRVAQIAAVALLIDYVVTVAVQCSAGTVAVASAIPALGRYSLEITIGVVLLIAYGNLRGIREAGRSFAAPTYLYAFFMVVMIAVGLVRAALGTLPAVDPRTISDALPVGHHSDVLSFAAIFVLLRSFANGGSSLTGFEAISNGISVFRQPESVHARRVLVAMALILGVLVGGVSLLAYLTHVPPRVTGYPSVVAQEARLVFGDGVAGHVLFALLQIASALILYTGGNTSFNGFPFLASFVAEDSFLPRQLTKRGHRLVYSNGIIVLTAVAVALLLVTGARVNALVPFYAIGVFTGFTMAGAGLVRYHWRRRGTGWRRWVVINFLAAVMCAAVVLIFAIVKFTEGAWVVVVLFPILVFALIRINERYRAEQAALAAQRDQVLTPANYVRHQVYVLVNEIDLASLAALRYAATLRPTTLSAVHVAIDGPHARTLQDDWQRIIQRIPLEIVNCPDRRLERAVMQLVFQAAQRPGTHVTVVLPRRRFGWLGQLMHDRTADKLAGIISRIPNVVATIVPHDALPREFGRRHAAAMAERQVTNEGAIARSAPPDGLVADDGATRIAALRWRQTATVVGRIHSVEVQPVGAAPTLRCEVFDDTGGIQVLFLGRRTIPGIEPGRCIRLTGTVTEHRGSLAIFNPKYELLTEP
ncbi:amino acid/polyamine/organocation transporter, APC superfamily [Acidothermus cellulolyticus 11B]|uniref:Amino acid/polyamine/organocation transporter, APC superfamily n=1 Tax=Acidothermus cellulolyticus (strain ATCC 43068 / DSM 8971 / 11B) TaxID=351607 RepID=A0LU56_ACIC1|nr:amino acid/polyamine/organocation transporter, APC superfamily [Acidothermus cellulolyticus 11B]